MNLYVNTESRELVNMLSARATRGFYEETREMIEDAAQAAERVMKSEIPVDSGTALSSIQREGPRYFPGGAGGGGSHRATVKAGGPEAPHVIDFYFGTGNFGPSRYPIKPVGAQALAFHADPGNLFLFSMSSKGQPPQQRWVENAQDAALSIIVARSQTIGS